MYSTGVSRVFRLVLLVGLVVSSLGVTLAVVHLFFPALIPSLGGIVAWLRVASLVLLVVSYFAYSMWIDAFHADLVRVLPGYPVTLGAARAMIWIPLYNLWGWFRLFTLLGGYLSKKHGDLHRYTRQVLVWMPFIYGLGAGLVLWGVVAMREGVVNEGWEVVGAGLVPVGYLLCLGMTTNTIGVVDRAMHAALPESKPQHAKGTS